MTNYRDVREQILSGHIGLVRTGNLIGRQGRSEYSHAFLCAWRNADQRTLLIAESREGRGGQILTLSSQVRRFPAQIDIYRPTLACPCEVTQRAATIAINWAGRRYGYPNILRIALVHRPGLRAMAELLGYEFDVENTTPSPWDEPKVCSQLVAWAYRKAREEVGTRCSCPLHREMSAWDPAPQLGDRYVEPGDLARSGFELVFKGLVIE